MWKLTLIKGNVFDSNPWVPNTITAFIHVPYQIAGVAPPVVSMSSHAAQFTSVAFFEESGVSFSHLCLPHSQFRPPNQYIFLHTDAYTEVSTLLLALLAPQHRYQSLVLQYAFYCVGDWETCWLAKRLDLLEG